MYEFSSPLQRSLPTMYDLPSEEIGESGLPDEFHRMQAELLRETCRSPRYQLPFSPESDTDSPKTEPGKDKPQLFIASDLNLYYDSRNTSLCKRPDWFLSLDLPHANGLNGLNQRSRQRENGLKQEQQRAQQSESDYQALLKQLQEKGIDPNSL